MSLSVCPPFVCPPGINIPHTQVRGGQTFLTHRREGGQTFFTQRGWNKPFYIDGGTNILASRGGGQTSFVGGSGSFDDVDDEMDVSDAKFLMSKADIFVKF